MCLTWSKLRHPGVVQFLGVYLERSSRLPVLTMEKMDTSLRRYLEDRSKEEFPPPQGDWATSGVPFTIKYVYSMICIYVRLCLEYVVTPHYSLPSILLPSLPPSFPPPSFIPSSLLLPSPLSLPLILVPSSIFLPNSKSPLPRPPYVSSERFPFTIQLSHCGLCRWGHPCNHDMDMPGNFVPYVHVLYVLYVGAILSPTCC